MVSYSTHDFHFISADILVPFNLHHFLSGQWQPLVWPSTLAREWQIALLNLNSLNIFVAGAGMSVAILVSGKHLETGSGFTFANLANFSSGGITPNLKTFMTTIRCARGTSHICNSNCSQSDVAIPSAVCTACMFLLLSIFGHYIFSGGAQPLSIFGHYIFSCGAQKM